MTKTNERIEAARIEIEAADRRKAARILTPADEGRKAASQDKAMQDRLGLIKDTWMTGDTCQDCQHDGMIFTAEDHGHDGDGGAWWKGSLRCPKCGSLDLLVFITEEEIPAGLLIEKG